MHRIIQMAIALALLAIVTGGAVASLLNTPQMCAQSASTVPAVAPTFEVASVRLVPANKRGLTSISAPGAEFFSAHNVSIAVLIEMALSVNDYQISGKPSWFDSELYDVAAKPEGHAGLTNDQLKPMLQQLLQQRFRLSYHRATKPFSGYALVIAKGGMKLQRAKGASQQAYILPDGLRGQNMPIEVLASMLSRPLGRPVIDRTGLKGNFDIQIRYAPNGTTDSSLPSVFRAVEEDLGLKLEAQKVPVEMLVIDHLERVPTEN